MFKCQQLIGISKNLRIVEHPKSKLGFTSEHVANPQGVLFHASSVSPIALSYQSFFSGFIFHVCSGFSLDGKISVRLPNSGNT